MISKYFIFQLKGTQVQSSIFNSLQVFWVFFRNDEEDLSRILELSLLPE